MMEQIAPIILYIKKRRVVGAGPVGSQKIRDILPQHFHVQDPEETKQLVKLLMPKVLWKQSGKMKVGEVSCPSCCGNGEVK